MLDPRRLATLRMVVEAGSFAGAAARLNYTQAAVSQHVAELERACGLRVLERRPVRLTPAGEIALAAAHAVDDAVVAADTALRALRDGRSGPLRIAAFASAVTHLLAPALPQIAECNPGVEVTVTAAEPAVAYAGLVDGRFDFAVTFDYDVAPDPGPRVIARDRLGDDPVLVALPAGHRLASRRAVRLDELARDPWIAAPAAGLPLAALREAAGGAFATRARYEGEDFAAVLALVAAGLGIALLPRLATAAAPAGVVVLPLIGRPILRRLYAAQAANRPSPAGDALHDVLRASM